jgi:hypothetical protein
LSRQYNLNVQYQFAPRWVLEVGFVGSSGINQTDYNHDYNIASLASPSNPINGVTTNTVANAVFRVPYLGYGPGQLQGTGYDLVYNYNSLQVTLRHQFSHGLAMQAAYTWSKDLTNDVVVPPPGPGGVGGVGDNQANINNPTNTWGDYGPAGFERPQRFVVNYSYDLPFGNHTGALGWLAKGWQLAGVVVVQSGEPLTLTTVNGGSAFTGGPAANSGESGASTVQLAPGATYSSLSTPGGVESRLGGSGSTNGYFNLSAITSNIAINPNGTATTVALCPTCATLYGNAGLGILQGPGQFNWDQSLIKTTKFGERQSLQFRVEAFNILNHPQFGNPATTYSTASTFGQITTTSTNPRIIQLGLKYLF